MVEMIYKMIRADQSAKYINVENVGNASGASLPMLLSMAAQDGEIKAGNRLLLCGFGGGLSWAICSLTWAKNVQAFSVDVPTDFRLDSKLPDPEVK